MRRGGKHPAGLAGKACIVTGSTRGIGRALARALAEAGAAVAVSGRDPAVVEARAADLRAAGGRAIGAPGDVGRDGEARKIVAAAVEAFGRVDILVNNAAVLAPPKPLVETSPEEWDEVLRTNVAGTVNMIRHALPAMKERGSGLIVNLSSGWGRVGEANVASYCASKWAIEGLTQSVAEEAGQGVTVIAVNPGVIATEMLATAFGGDVSSFPPPEESASRWLRLLEKAEPSWSGRSFDLTDY